MKKIVQVLFKFLKWSIILILGFYVLIFTISGFKKVNKNGSWDVYWSGLEALWDNDEVFGFWTNKIREINFDGIDGPYILGDQLFYVDDSNRVQTQNFNLKDSVLVNQSKKEHFQVTIVENHQIEEEIYLLPEKLIAISDIEGNFTGFSSFLKSNGVIDDNYNWTFGDGHLVLVGDFVDRGQHVTQVLWLIYKLEQESEKHNGKVHFILGNHEVMNFGGNWSYNDKKYIKIAQTISGYQDWDKAISLMYSDKTELGKWMRSKNVIEKIGNYIFVHAGLHPQILDFNVGLKEINQKTRSVWGKEKYNEIDEDKLGSFLMGQKGPLWYRGMVTNSTNLSPELNSIDLDRILAFYDSKTIVVGHSIVKEISKDFDGRAIRIDLKHGTENNSGKTKGLLIQEGIEYIIDDRGNKTRL